MKIVESQCDEADILIPKLLDFVCKANCNPYYTVKALGATMGIIALSCDMSSADFKEFTKFLQKNYSKFKNRSDKLGD